MIDFLKTETEIIAWLKEYRVRDYELVADKHYGFVVNVNNDVDLKNQDLYMIPVKFNLVAGSFNVRGNRLQNLAFAPSDIMNVFDCSFNHIENLEGGPRYAGDFLCHKNRLTSLKGAPAVAERFNCGFNQLTSLQYAPSETGDFICNHNLLKSLEFCPTVVEGQFDCRNNALENLLFCPPKVLGNFLFFHNPLLGSTQEITDIKEILAIHQATQRAYTEKKALEQAVEINADSLNNKPSQFKI